MIFALIPARTLSRLDTLAGDYEYVTSVLVTDLGVSIGVKGEISNRLHYGPDELVPIRAGLYEVMRLRGGYPNGPGGAYGLAERVTGQTVDVRG